MPAPEIRIRRGRVDSVIVPMFVKAGMILVGNKDSVEWQ